MRLQRYRSSADDPVTLSRPDFKYAVFQVRPFERLASRHRGGGISVMS